MPFITIKAAQWILSIALSLSLSVPTNASQAATSAAPSQWRITWQQTPATRATISWTTRTAGGAHRVHFATKSCAGNLESYSKVVDCQRSGSYTMQADSDEHAYFHHARLSDLTPSTTYYFVMSSDGATSRELHFTTAPADDRAFKLIYGGDSRTGIEMRQVMNRLMADLAAEDGNILGFAHGGDYIYFGESWPLWNAWLSQHELCTTAAGRVLPLLPVRGNHDVGPLFDEIFDDPGGATKNYYTTHLGAQVALITLNTEISAAGDQAVWLEQQLAELRPSKRWLLAQFHQPAYPAVKTPSVAKASWVPLFEKFNLDLVLESDGHVLKRTVPIRDDKQDPTGVTYVGEGGLGVPQRAPDTTRWYLQPPGMALSAHHVTLLEFSAEALHLRSLGPPAPLSLAKPEGYRALVAQGASWSYLAGSDPTSNWNSKEFDATSWKTGPAGFGYGNESDATVLADMRRNYERVYLRTTLPSSALEECKDLALLVRYDDGFIAYIDGQEVCRSNIEAGHGPEASRAETKTTPDDFEYFPIENWRDLIRGDEFVLSIEGHNDRRSSSDFELHPVLIADPAQVLGLADKGRVLLDEHTLRPR